MNKKQIKGWLKHGDFILLDIITMQLSFIIAYWIHVDFSSPYRDANYSFQAMMIHMSQLVVIMFWNSYSSILRRKWFDEIVAVFKYIVEVILVALLLLFMIHESDTASRLQVGITSVVFVVLASIIRTLNKIWIKKTSSYRAEKKSIVLITSQKLVKEAMQKLSDSVFYTDFTITAIILMDSAATWTGMEHPEDIDWEKVAYAFEKEYEIPVMLLGAEAIEELSHGWVDEVFLLQPDNMTFPGGLMDDFMKMGITMNYTMSAIDNDKWPVTDMRKLGGYKVLTSSIRFATAGEMMIKRIMDIAGGIVGCILTGIIFIFVAPIIYIKSPGPIFFSQERVGQNGKTFKMYKFRSMYMDAEKRKAELMAKNKMSDGMMFKVDDDPRIIGSEKKDKKGRPKGIGNFIRKTSLDEFPQFFNVLRGEMSLVGTRPPTLDEWNRYDLNHRVRMSIRPGLTGMWQVSGRSSITDFNDVVRLDREYIENWSIALDIKILLKTVAIVIMRSGAQ